ncbi:Protein of unknown function [Bacillus wiedmannii]|uniref:Uncharacterized protein n=1 Tax=Bacillus wiedmannii TaxID=1890302 RepID=A0A1C4G3W8_9BACI|nr:Protein of unknown function [Bacillus wiedmannii]SCN10919.1 Protein of unknown function [Bacillus wiedmannii]
MVNAKELSGNQTAHTSPVGES